MKFKIISRGALLFILLATPGITPLCHAEASTDKASIAAVKQETDDLLQALKAYTAAQRDEAIQASKEALDKLDRRIDALEARIDNNWDKMDKAARAQARANLKALRKQRTKVAEWYGSLKTSSVNAWAHMKKGFSHAYSALQDAWEQAEKELGPDK